MSYEPDTGGAPGLVIPLEASLEVEDESPEEELSNVGELGVDDGCQGGVDMGEGGRRCLGLDDALTQQTWRQYSFGMIDMLLNNTSATDNILSKEFPDDDSNVGAVDLVDQTVDGLLKSLPGQPLVGFTVLVSDVLLHHPELGRGNVGSSGLGRQQLLLLLGSWSWSSIIIFGHVFRLLNSLLALFSPVFASASSPPLSAFASISSVSAPAPASLILVLALLR